MTDQGALVPGIEDALQAMVGRVRATLGSVPEGFPHYADTESGVWTTTPDGFWTGGFWVGELWLAAHVMDDDGLVSAARSWAERLAPRAASRTVFRGFLFYYGAALGYLLHGDGRARDLAVAAAERLLEDFDPRLGLIPLGSDAEEAHTVGGGETNIDGLVAAPLMLVAAGLGGNAAMREVAIRHAERNAALHVRPDGSVIQSVSLDPATGEALRSYTHKGYTDSSTWTRAQAWAMQFFTLAARMAPDRPDFLATAEQVSDWWIDRAPDDGIAYWDFDAPVDETTRKDTSGTAIAAAALFKLAALTADPAKAARYDRSARKSLEALVERHLRPTGILGEGCFDHREGVALSNELIWGSYYLLEGLSMLTGKLPRDAV